MSYTISEAREALEKVKKEIARAFIGQEELVNQLLITLLAGGHILVEGVPGLGKTLLVRSAAKALGGDSRRIQFTPDLMPSDVTGSVILDTSTGNFITKKGPVFTNILIADEINRSPAKTQASLFEAMQEYQVSLDGVSHTLPKPFMVMATENPFEHEGTYPLPDAQKDRFLMKALMTYPPVAEEKLMVEQVLSGETGAELTVSAVNTVMNPGDFAAIQNLVSSMHCDNAVIDYAVRLCTATRSSPVLECGAGPRGSLSLIRCARAKALLEDRDFIIPDDVKALAVPVLAHRLTLSAEGELEGLTENNIVESILSAVEAPRK
ncbi:MAG: MoxR family ATPase [Treponema sp.]|nr:MoxR family ATPase [Treponema sp.]